MATHLSQAGLGKDKRRTKKHNLKIKTQPMSDKTTTHNPKVTTALAMTTSSPPSQSSNIIQERGPLLTQLTDHFEGLTSTIKHCAFAIE